MRAHVALTALLGAGAALTVAAAGCEDDTTITTPKTGATCVPPPRAMDSMVMAVPAFNGTKFALPVEMVLGPNQRFYVLEQAGAVRILDPRTGGVTTALELGAKVTSGGESGLLGIAFDPKFAENGFVYLDYTAPLGGTIPNPNVVFQSVISRFHSNDGGATIDTASEKRVLVVDQPFANHNGGHIAFGPDGYLYIAFGDGGSAGDPNGNGQNKSTLLGKILRIDVHQGNPYAIPPTNPFVAGGGRPEIFTYGMRNTWKFSFDPATGEMWGGDVGQDRFEEVDLLVAGGNYGWNTREGKHCYRTTTCSSEGFIDPVVDYDHADASSITGGYVYYGKKLPGLTGKYIHGDFNNGRIFAVEQTGTNSYAPRLLAETHTNISTFGQDGEGELYIADYFSGSLFALVAAAADAGAPAASGVSLNDTGCLDPAAPISYTVNTPLWSDGATKTRTLFIPPGTKIGVRDDGDFDLPPGSVAVKTFEIAGKKIETRLFVRYEDSSWAGYSYEWNDEQTDATLLASGKTKALDGGQSWTFPSRAQCFSCHTAVAGFTLGLEARQLDHPEDDGRNQLDRLAPFLDKTVVSLVLPPLTPVDAPGATAEARARSYLHANCSMCHREGSGAGAATMDLRIGTAFAATKTCKVAPQAGNLGVAGAAIIAPGDPARSALAFRMRALNEYRMPPLATHVVDETGAAAVEAWIQSLAPTCP